MFKIIVTFLYFNTQIIKRITSIIMKTLKLLLLVLTISITTNINAQTADEIIAKYFENTGGAENWSKIEGITIYAKINQGGMEIPIKRVQLKDGKQMMIITFQGKEIKQGVYDGETLWSTNFMTQKAEKSDQETTDNMKLEVTDFPDPFLNYKEKGYSVDLLGKETIDGAETFKIKLTKKPITVDGIKEENVSYYFFDTENFVPIAIQNEIKSGEAKGMISEIKMSDYQEVDGLFLPFSMTQGVKDQPGAQPITVEKVEFNPTVDMNDFKFPEESSTEGGKN